MNTYKAIALFLLISFTAIALKAQESTLKISYDKNAKLLLNDLSLSKKTTIDQVIELLGKPNRKTVSTIGETTHFYEELGIVVMSMDGLVNGLGINFNWANTDKFPEKSFIGKLALGEYLVTLATNRENIASIEMVGFACPIDIMCVTTDKKAKNICVISYSDELLNEVVFVLK